MTERSKIYDENGSIPNNHVVAVYSSCHCLNTHVTHADELSIGIIPTNGLFNYSNDSRVLCLS